VISERFEERIAEAMGHPTHDPHGDPIPTSDLSLPSGDSLVLLEELPVGFRGILVRVGAQEPDNLNLLRRVGLSPGSTVEVVAKDKRGIRLRVRGERILLPKYLAATLWMEQVNG
jgi:DtxR family Mn-dependent transcriptional regulator